MTNTNPVRPPRGLDAAGRDLWRSIARQIHDDGLELDARETALLTEACREADVLARIEEALKGAPVVVDGAKGQPAANPLIGEARRSRQTIQTLLRGITLEDPLADAAGRGSGSRTTSWQARAAATSRHRGA